MEPILIGLLRKANDLYYNSDKSLFSDETYDTLKDILEERKPDATILNQVGTEILDNDKEVLPFHMGSIKMFSSILYVHRVRKCLLHSL